MKIVTSPTGYVTLGGVLDFICTIISHMLYIFIFAANAEIYRVLHLTITQHKCNEKIF